MVLTKMPVIDAIVKLVDSKNFFKKTLFVCNQHLLYTTVDLFDGLILLGAEPQNIFLIGKIYSTCEEVYQIFLNKQINVLRNRVCTKLGCFQGDFQADIQDLWAMVHRSLTNKNIEQIVILDDGGSCLVNTPSFILNNYPVIGIEQTSSGLVKINEAGGVNFPVIEVASSAAKQKIESPMIAQSVIEKLIHLFPENKKKLKCGVVGFGVVGKAVAQNLLALGHAVYVYDNDRKKSIPLEETIVVNSMEEILTFCDYIFGCAGKDIVEDVNITQSVKSNKVFVSCSSQDKEFHSLLLEYKKFNSVSIENPLSDIEFKIAEKNYIKILRGGFPINLNNSGYAVRASDIQMTRGLLFSALIQAIKLLNNYEISRVPKRIMLCPYSQKFVANRWMPFASPYMLPHINRQNLSSIEWFLHHSGGEIFGFEYTVPIFNQVSALIA